MFNESTFYYHANLLIKYYYLHQYFPYIVWKILLVAIYIYIYMGKYKCDKC